MKKLEKIVLVLISLSLIIHTSSYACVGIRPMAMGGAFIAVSNDANATYWNPAGLDQEKERVIKDRLEGREFTYTPTLYNRNEVNYDDFISFITPIKIKDKDVGVMGLSFVNSGYNTNFSKITKRWFGLSYGRNIAHGLSLGINLRYQKYKEQVKSGWWVLYPSGLVIGPEESGDEFFAIDPAIFWRLGKFSFGILYQNVNEPKAKIFDINYIGVKNLRPGIAFKLDDKTTIALDMYDALGKTEDVSHDLRIGIEKCFDLPKATHNWLGDNLALRLGGYHINNDAKRVLTFGFGLRSTQPQEYQSLPKEVELGYCLLYWTDVPPGIHEFTQQLGITLRF